VEIMFLAWVGESRVKALSENIACERRCVILTDMFSILHFLLIEIDFGHRANFRNERK
jgi:hypothetical protein